MIQSCSSAFCVYKTSVSQVLKIFYPDRRLEEPSRVCSGLSSLQDSDRQKELRRLILICPNGTRSVRKCTKAWPCRQTSPLTHTNPGITSILRPTLRSTSRPPEFRACCPPCPTCSPATRPTSPTALAGTTGGRRAPRTDPLLLPAAPILRTASTRTAHPSAATRAGTHPTRARWFSETARGPISTGAPWCARSADPTPAPTPI